MGTAYSERTRDRVEEELLWRELDYRKADGVEVFLQWHKRNNVLRVILNDEKEGLSHTFPVPNDKGLEGFNHPFAYAAYGQVATREYMPEGYDGKIES